MNFSHSDKLKRLVKIKSTKKFSLPQRLLLLNHLKNFLVGELRKTEQAKKRVDDRSKHLNKIEFQHLSNDANITCLRELLDESSSYADMRPSIVSRNQLHEVLLNTTAKKVKNGFRNRTAPASPTHRFDPIVESNENSFISKANNQFRSKRARTCMPENKDQSKIMNTSISVGHAPVSNDIPSNISRSEMIKALKELKTAIKKPCLSKYEKFSNLFEQFMDIHFA
ncbi:hypothetical protein Ciccas_003061 [Cichlidogyrus casuarinus]|uniref:Uncharacterized protein n=1 Tax=Cichlidogyrus casuarinus TaxID=1844966 RepID=A0ABD2QFG7_9PLAT